MGDPAEDLARAWGINPYAPAPSNLKPIPQPPQKSMAIFSRDMAERYEGILRPYVGQWVVLYGGGGNGQNVVKLLKVKAQPAEYHPSRIGDPIRQFEIDEGYKILSGYRVPSYVITFHKNELGNLVYYSLDDWIVEVTLQPSPQDKKYGSYQKSAWLDKAGKYHGPSQLEPTWTKHLGSWRLAAF